VNNDLQYPLHVATGWHLAGSSFLPKIVKRLLKEFPPAARFPDKDGTLPVHNAAYYGKVDDIEVILNAFPEAIRHRTNDGRLPLHFACCAESSNEKLDFLIEKYPEGLTVYDKAGYLPFHSIFLHEESNALAVTMMELMIQRMGCATLPPTKAGVPPLLKACENDVELNVIWKLVQHSPELFHVPNTRSPFKERRVSN
jgi:ankyrin repeat protein